VEPLDPRGLTGWRVTSANGDVRTYTGVVVANGHYWATHTPTYPGTFAGNQIHSKDYKRPADLTGPRVLVVGAGDSGCDLAVESATTFGSSDLLLRRAYWFLPKYVLGIPSSKFDVLSVPVPKFLEEAAFRGLVFAGMGRFSSFGLEKPRHRFFEQDLVVNHSCRTSSNTAVSGSVPRSRDSTATQSISPTVLQPISTRSSGPRDSRPPSRSCPTGCWSGRRASRDCWRIQSRRGWPISCSPGSSHRALARVSC
jgi:hypothetical protein